MDAEPRTSERYDETVGSTEVGPYTATGAIMFPCPNCGAPEGIRCTVSAPPTGPIVGSRKRKVPCLSRLKAAEAHP